MGVGAATPDRQCETTSVSSLWTPSGDHVPTPDDEPAGSPSPASGGAPGDGAPDAAEVEEELRRVRAELAATPVADIIANHAVGLWQLAVLHLTPDGDDPPNLDEAGLAIDAMAGIIENLGDRLGENADPLRDALAQLRLAFVQVRDRD